jgi:Zn-dependent metalloprotease
VINRINPIQCIIPPHMSREIAERGSPTQRERALRSLAISGQFRGRREALAVVVPFIVLPLVPEKERHVYDAEHGSSLPGRLVRSEGDLATGDPAVDEAYDGSGATYDLYRDVYGRNSIDDRGMRLDSTVHYEQGYDNAFWNGQQMVYGDGDEDLPEEERLFNRFTIALDIIAHELTHGVTQYEANLIYWGQSGALNESCSDIFGSLVKQRMLNQTADEADWLIGEGLFTPNVNGQGIRSMKAPGTAYDDPVLGKDPQPAHMRDYKDVSYDNGGVHINSGIPNHAFYVTAREIGGYAWEKAGQIWYVALRDKLQIRSDFGDAARLTFQAAGELFGSESLQQQAVRKGWDEVGISVEEEEKEGCWEQIKAFFGAS